jgi:cytochrome c-type biogenesis protein CcmE
MYTNLNRLIGVIARNLQLIKLMMIELNRNIIYHITNNPIQIKQGGLGPEENISGLPSDDVFIQGIAQKN